MSVFRPDARVHRDEQDRLHQDSGQQRLDVRARRASQRPAEHVREQQREHDRRDGHVEELKRHVLDLQHRAPGQRRDRRQRRDGPGLDAREQRAAAAGDRAWTHDAASVVAPALAPLPLPLPLPAAPVASSPASPAPCPVNAKNTSSRLGCADGEVRHLDALARQRPEQLGGDARVGDLQRERRRILGQWARVAGRGGDDGLGPHPRGLDRADGSAACCSPPTTSGRGWCPRR